MDKGLCIECGKRPVRHLGKCHTCYYRAYFLRKRQEAREKLVPTLPLCLCGCGKHAPGFKVKWLPGHKVAFAETTHLCACGCGELVKGETIWKRGHTRIGMTGQKHTEESKHLMSIHRKGKKFTAKHKMALSRAMRTSGANMHQRHSLIRKWTVYKEWRKAVFERDNFTCQECGVKGGYLEADHIVPFSIRPDLILSVANGRTLCLKCHRKTKTWGQNVKKDKRFKNRTVLQILLETVLP